MLARISNEARTLDVSNELLCSVGRSYYANTGISRRTVNQIVHSGDSKARLSSSPSTTLLSICKSISQVFSFMLPQVASFKRHTSSSEPHDSCAYHQQVCHQLSD